MIESKRGKLKTNNFIVHHCWPARPKTLIIINSFLSHALGTFDTYVNIDICSDDSSYPVFLLDIKIQLWSDWISIHLALRHVKLLSTFLNISRCQFDLGRRGTWETIVDNVAFTSTHNNLANVRLLLVLPMRYSICSWGIFHKFLSKFPTISRSILSGSLLDAIVCFFSVKFFFLSLLLMFFLERH